MLRVEIERQHEDRPMYSGALELTCTCFFGFPENMSEKKKMTLVGKPHVFKPDASNLQKLIEDVCTKLLYHDDSSIAIVHFYKVYDYVPRTEFFITEIK
jgi:Holliday junction resolvase RusA-like endonuclease